MEVGEPDRNRRNIVGGLEGSGKDLGGEGDFLHLSPLFDSLLLQICLAVQSLRPEHKSYCFVPDYGLRPQQRNLNAAAAEVSGRGLRGSAFVLFFLVQGKAIISLIISILPNKKSNKRFESQTLLAHPVVK